ncbi:MAG: asparagine synthetase B, partial [Candidatus Moraniibacteriota bacterium]
MCGIVGVIGKKENIPVGQYLKILRKATAHRGPDDFGEHLGDNFGFANLRLSIVDVAGGKQPIYNDDK